MGGIGDGGTGGIGGPAGRSVTGEPARGATVGKADVGPKRPGVGGGACHPGSPAGPAGDRGLVTVPVEEVFSAMQGTVAPLPADTLSGSCEFAERGGHRR